MGALAVSTACGGDETDDDGPATGPSSSGTGAGGCSAEQYACAASGCCDCPPKGMASAQALGQPVAAAHGADLDGDGAMDLLIAWTSGDVAVLSPNACGVLEPRSEIAGAAPTGMAVGELDTAPGTDAVLFDASFMLSARTGLDLTPLWQGPVAGLTSAGAALAAHLDGDGDHDVAAFDASNASLLRVENTGSGWNVRATVMLPAGISRVAAGELGGGPRDELLFLGGGLVEVVSVADFDYSDVRVLSAAPHPHAAFGDFDGDGDGDAAVAAGSQTELWTGNGSTTITLGASATLDGAIVGLTSHDRDGAAPPEIAVVTQTGAVTVLAGAGLQPGEQAQASGDAVAVLSGDVDRDGKSDLVIVGASGQAWVWRTP